MAMRLNPLFVAGVFLLGFLTGCTQPGETTGIGAATGGVIGAGLGAIVGNQTGNPGSGLVIGAAAGAGTGAMVGNALQAQEETLRSQDEAIERQEQLIRAQKSELEELRKMNQAGDSTSAQLRKKYSMAHPSSASAAASSAAATSPAMTDVAEKTASEDSKAEARKKAFNETTKAKKPVSEKASFDWNKEDSKTLAKGDAGSDTESSECSKASAEITKGGESTDSAEKLFHYRRALRFCPNNAEYHNKLGELYLSLNRKDDAEFEYKEALRLDPSNSHARANLEYAKTK